MQTGARPSGDERRLLPGQLYLDDAERACICLRVDGDRVEGLSLRDGEHPLFCARDQLPPAGLPEEARQAWARVAIQHYAQIAPLLEDAYHAYPFAGGSIYLNVRESHMMLARVLGLYEPVKTRRILQALGPGMSFVDVGGNKGDFALIAAARVGAGGTVLAFEPEPGNAAWIAKSIELNGYGNIRLMQCALGDEDASSPLYLGECSGWHTLLPGRPARDKGVIQVQQRRLDAVLEELGNPFIDMMKIDVEGGEAAVLRGARHSLAARRIATLLIDVHPHLGVNPLELGELLQSHGYQVTALTPGGEAGAALQADTTELVATLGAG